MASNLLSRLLPSATDEPFENDPLHPQPRRSSTSTDGQHDMDIDEENFGAYFEPQDLEHLLEEATGSQITTDSRAVSPEARRKANAPPGINTANRAAGWKQPGPARPLLADDDEDVPQSLLLEGGPSSPQATRRTDGLPPPCPALRLAKHARNGTLPRDSSDCMTISLEHQQIPGGEQDNSMSIRRRKHCGCGSTRRTWTRT